MSSPHMPRGRMAEALVLAAFDGVYIFIAYFLAIVVTPGHFAPFVDASFEHSLYYVVFVLFWFWECLELGLWGTARNEDSGTYLMLMIKGLAKAMVFSTFVLVLITDQSLDKYLMAAFFGISLILLLIARPLFQAALMLFRWKFYAPRRVLIVGANERTAHLIHIMQSRAYLGYRIEGFIESDPARAAVLEKLGIMHRGGFDSLNAVLAEHDIDEVFVSLPVRSCYDMLESMEQVCEKNHIPLYLVADIFPMRIAKRCLGHIGDVPVVSFSAVPESRALLAIKRAFDFFASSALILAFSPIFIATAIAIKRDSKGPVFFFQERVGQNQRRFKMVKFRSMRIDAEEIRASLEAMNEADGPVFKIKNDPRITRVGRFIRKFSIDELPQLFNVWVGQMSLVGPRPPIPSEVIQYTWTQRRRLSVKPGMTGLWQVSGRSNIDFEHWVELDLTYIDSWSLWLDFVILLRTFGAVIEGRGAA